MTKIHFEEEQRMTQWWLWLFLIALVGFFLYAIYKQLIVGEPFGENPMSDTGLIIFSVFIIGIVLLFLAIRLRTSIDEKGIQMTYRPFGVKKLASWEEMESVDIVKYGFVGYGIRWGSSYGTVYNVKGNKGIAITLKNGKKYLIGTQQPEAVSSMLKEIPSK